MLKISGSILLLLINCHLMFAGKVLLTGSAADYAGQKIIFLRYENQLTYKEESMAAAMVSANGDFACQLTIAETTYVFAHLGKYQVFFYAEPGKEYTIQLPQRADKLPGEKINPYFEEDKIQLTILNTKNTGPQKATGNVTDLNQAIRQFNAVYEPVFALYSMNAYIKMHSYNLDSMIRSLDSLFSGINHLFFRDYYKYRIGMLKFSSSRFKSKHISDNFFLNRPILYNNPAYMELFNQVYEKYFVYFGRTPAGHEIYDAINEHKSLALLKATLMHDKVLSNDTLLEMVILKGIHDGFYEMDFSRNALLEILDSLKIGTKIALHKQYVADIREKVTKLLPGYNPPAFKLLNQDSMWMSNEDLKGTLTYIVFCTTQNYVCFKEFDQLKKIQQKYGNMMKIVTISVDDSLQAMQSFCNKYHYNWTFLYFGDQPDVIKDYDIRTFPTYYMFDSDGKMLSSPAPSPSENVEVYIFNYLKEKKLL